MSIFRFGQTQGDRDDFWSGQAVMETKFSVGNMVAARESKLNQGKAKIGDLQANAANTGVQVNFLVLMDKTNIVGNGYTPPVVYDSLTGFGYRKGESKWDLMERLSLVGRAQSSVNYQGTVPEQKDISVQVGGLCGLRLFMKQPGEVLAWGDRLVWTVPDVGDDAEAKATYRHLNSLSRAEFPKGKVPVLVEKMSEQMHAELPVAAMAYLRKLIDEGKDITAIPTATKHPLERYILTNFFPQLQMYDLVTSLNAGREYHISLLNFGLLTQADKKVVSDAVGLSDDQAKQLHNFTHQQLAGQLDCFTWLRDHNFGKAMSVGVSGDAIKVLLRIT